MSSAAQDVEKSARLRWSSNSPQGLAPDRAAFLKKHLRGETVLDLGCARGAYTEFVRSAGFRAVGLDISFGLLSAAAGRFGEAQFVLGDCQRLCFADGTFDNVVAFDVIEHVDEGLFMAEVRRVCRDIVVLSFPLRYEEALARHGLVYWHYLDASHLRYYERTAIPSVLAKNGFRQIELLETDAVELSRALVNSLEYPRLVGRLLGRFVAMLRVRGYFQTVLAACSVQP